MKEEKEEEEGEENSGPRRGDSTVCAGVASGFKGFTLAPNPAWTPPSFPPVVPSPSRSRAGTREGGNEGGRGQTSESPRARGDPTLPTRHRPRLSLTRSIARRAGPQS